MLEAGYVIGFGSNLDPARNAGRVLRALTERFGRLYTSSAYVTAPVAIAGDKDFLNAALFVPTDLAADELKACCSRLEIELGRDRSRPDRKLRDRTADLDLLTPRVDPAELHGQSAAQVCDAIYMRDALEQLLSGLRGGSAAAASGQPVAEVVLAPGLVLGREARWLERAALAGEAATGRPT